jgi:hypothetical protein
MATTINVLSAGQLVQFGTIVPKYANYTGLVFRVKAIDGVESSCPVARLVSEPDGEDAVKLPDVPLAYLRPAIAPLSARRPVLNLHSPKDERSEKEKQAECESWLLSCGYHVLGIGQWKRQAVCTNCTNQNRRQSGNPKEPLVKVFCRGCGRPAYALDTGNTEGAGDWIIRHPDRWPVHAVLCQEWKRDEKSARRQKQVELSEAGWYPIVDSRLDCARAILAFERDVLRVEWHPELYRYILDAEEQL